MKAPLLPPFADWFSAHGRLNRKQYFFCLVVLSTFGLLIMTPLVLTFEIIFFDHNSQAALAVLLLSLGFATLWGYAMFCLHAKRLHDLGLPAVIASAFVLSLPFVLVGFSLMYFGIGHSWLPDLFKALGGFARDVNVGMGAYLMLAPGEKHDNLYGNDPLRP